jgi:hypothetical protein
VLLVSFFLEVILFQLYFVLLHHKWRLCLFLIRHYRFFGFIFLLVASSPIISFYIIGYRLCRSGEPITLISTSILVNIVTKLLCMLDKVVCWYPLQWTQSVLFFQRCSCCIQSRTILGNLTDKTLERKLTDNIRSLDFW